VNLVLATLGVGVASALIPLVNIEAYLAALATQTTASQAPALALAAGVGQTMGKVVWYAIAMKSMTHPWVQKKMSSDKMRASVERWHERTTGRPVIAGAVVLCSAFTGFPPLLAIAVVAGAIRMPFWVFLPTCLVGRVARFYLLLVGVETVFG
jgi:membrane protein YqaA with SNARE-associated domain